MIEIEPGELTGIFNVPGWLRDVGMMSWLLLGVALLIGALVWIASLTQVIVVPVIVAAIIATVGSPLVALLQRWHLPRGLSTLLVMLLIVLAGCGIALLVVHGIVSEADSLGHELSAARDKITSALHSLGLDRNEASHTTQAADRGASSAISTLLSGLAAGISGLSSTVFFLAMVTISLLFLLKDGPVIRGWVEDHSGLPRPVARIVGNRAIRSLRGYFLGVTIVSAYTTVIVLVASIVIGLPLVGAIAVVTFVAGFVPYLGAWTAGVFTVLIALGSGGTDAAIAMAAVQLLANGVLQQLIQPFAMGSALGIHPLAVLVVTIAGGALFGAIGLILAAPIVAAITGITSDLKQAETRADPAGESAPA